MLKFLNDECLVEIFQYLDLREQLNLALLDERFRPLIVERIWRKFHIFKHFPSNMLTFREYKMFLYLIAPYITELTLDEDVEDYCYLTPNYDFYFWIEYPQLRKLYLSGGHFQDNYFMRLARNCPKLELLDVDCWSVTCESLCQLPNLQAVSLTIPEIVPIYLEKVFDNQKIVHMRLKIEAKITNKQDFNKILETIFPKITKLHYIDHRRELLLPDVLNSSAHLFPNIEILHVLDCERSIDFVCSLHTLRVLHLDNCKMELKDLFKVIENNVHLEHLYLYRGLMLRDNRNFTLSQHFTGEEVYKLSDLRRQQQKNEPSKRLLNIYMYKSLDLQHIVNDQDSNHGYQEPAIKIVEQPFPDDEDCKAERYFLDFMLKWN